MRHRSVEKEIIGISVTDTYVSGDMSLRIVAGGKAPDVHLVGVSSTVEFDRTEKDEFGMPTPGATKITWSINAAFEHLLWHLNARADEVSAALETVKVA